MPFLDLTPLARVPQPLVTRFAPSPTGHLHLGHVVNAIYTWGVARVVGATVLLRLEDHDRIRCREAYERSILEDLDWLGFIPDDGRTPVQRQSDAGSAYAGALERLRRAHHVYSCDCSRRDIRLREESGTAERYGGHCRDRALPDAKGLGCRVSIEPGTEHWNDIRLGPQTHAPAAQCGDLLLRDRNNHWTYQFAVTVDDLRQSVNLVIRGEDLLSSTGRQLRLARMLGRDAMPQFLHHPLLMKAPGDKLSKSDGDTGVRDLRAAGSSAAEVIGLAAEAIGLIETRAPVSACDVPALFR